MGAAMPLKLAMERKAASRVGHLPCLSVGRSRASLEVRWRLAGWGYTWNSGSHWRRLLHWVR